jgi:transcriptional regulator with XRE-family HTH domain
MKNPTTILRTFGGNVRDARLKLDLTQEELAGRCGLDFRQIGFIERGEINPTLKTIHKICKGLACTSNHLFRGL